MKLAIVSDIRLYREGISKILNDVDSIDVSAVADCYVNLVAILEYQNLDMLLLDMRMPEGHQILEYVTEVQPEIKVIAIAVPENEKNYLLCVESGVCGYLSKESTLDDLIEAVVSVYETGLYCPFDITQNILNSVKNSSRSNKIEEDKITYIDLHKTLTRRELQIVELLSEGLPNKKIATTLTIELSTVKNHVHNILVKMGVESRSEIVCLLQKRSLA